MSQNNNQKDKKKKNKKSVLETELLRIMEKSLKKTLDLALDEILKDFK